MKIKDETGDWTISYDKGLVISADDGQIGWVLSKEQEKQLAEYLCNKHNLNDFWFAMYDEYKEKHDKLIDRHFNLEDKYHELVKLIINMPVPKKYAMETESMDKIWEIKHSEQN